MIDLRTLETFVVVASTGGFHRAAEKLHTTQPAVSARIAQLESELKTRLFERDKRGCRLTVKGRDVLYYAERILALRNELVNSVAGTTALEGTVHLGVSDTIVHTMLPDFLKRISEVYPGITLEISVDSSANLSNSLLSRALDVALLMGRVAANDAVNLPLCSYDISWIVPNDFLLGPASVRLDEVASYPIITFARQTQPFWQLKELFQKSDLRRVRLFANSSLSSIVRMTLDGIGIAAIPRQVVCDHLSSGRLRELTVVGGHLPKMEFTASYMMNTAMPLSCAIAELAQSVANGRAED